MVSLQSLFGSDADILYDTNFQLLLLANSLGPLGTSLLSPVLDSLIDPFGVSATDIGLMISVYTAPGIVMIPIAGILADRFGRKRILLLGLSIFGIAGVSIATTTNYQIVLGLRLFQGIAFAGLTPVIITSIGDLYVESAEATAQGIRFTESGIVQAGFPLLAGVLVVIGWQFPFLIYALAIPVGILMFLWFEEPTSITNGDTTTTNHEPGRSESLTILELLRYRRVWALVIGRSFPQLVWIGFITYNSIIVIRLIGGTPFQAGMLVAIGSVTYAVAASQAGRITAYFNGRFYPLFVASVCLGVGLAIIVLSPVLLSAYVGSAIAGVGFGLALSLYRSVITGLAPESLRGSLVGLAESGGRVTATLAPLLMGGIIGAATALYSFSVAVQLAGLTVAGIGGLGGILCLLLARTAPPVKEHGVSVENAL